MRDLAIDSHLLKILQIRRFALWTLGSWVFADVSGSVALAAESSIQSFYIRQYKVEGAKRLKAIEVEEAVYPYLGPGRTPDDVEQARAALEKTYHDKGFQSVSVGIPAQDPRRGVIRLEVVEGKVGRLRVNGARWFLPSAIRREVPSLAEGSVPDFNQVQKEILAVNRLADRRVTPEQPKPGMEPGSLDFDLTVEDKFPLHGSLELNNRYSADTTPLRLNGSLSYANLFQKGQTAGVSFQMAPENTDDAMVYSAYYLARVSDGVSLMLQGTKQNSDISTLGGAAVGGRGEIVGLRAMFDLPTSPNFYQTFSLGVDYKNFEEDIVVGKKTVSSPIEYYPLSANHSASWMGKNRFTELNTSVNLHLRGMGSGETDYANKRYGADGSFIYLRADASHTHDIVGGAQVFGKVQGQLSSQPLVNSEQFAGGGLGTARGYLEATSLGDNGIFGTFELRSPTLIGKGRASDSKADEWRFLTFADAGLLQTRESLPGQRNRFGFASVGLGSRVRYLEHFNGSVDVAVPLIDQTHSDIGDVRVTFRGWADF